MPAVTMIVPTCNRPQYLARALASIATQTFPDYEVIVVNDAGSDPSPVVEHFETRMKIRLENHDRNKGLAAARNTGISVADSALLGFLDDDDLLHPQHLQSLHDCLAGHPSPAAAYSLGAQIIEDESGAVLKASLLPCPPQFDHALIQVTNYIPVLCLLVPRAEVAALGGFDTSLDVLEDWDLWIKLSKLVDFHHHPEVTCEYRLRGGKGNMTTRDVARFDRCLAKVYENNPVDPDSALAHPRQQMLASSRPRAEAFLYDTSVVVASAGDLDQLAITLGSVVEGLHGASYEVILHLPRNQSTTTFASQLSGDVVVTFSDQPLDPASVRDIGNRRAAGRNVMHLVEGELFQPAFAALS